MKKYPGYTVTAAVFLALSLFFRFVLAGYGFLALCCAGLSALTLVYMGLKIWAAKREKPARRCKMILTCAAVLGLLAAAATEVYIVARELAPGGEGGYAIVLGAGVDGTRPSLSLKARLEAALEYAKENPEAVMILSGGQGGGEDISEAQCMYDWLTREGVDPGRLVMEDKSTSTVENLTFSLEKLRAMDPDFAGVTIITAGYHIARAGLMARDLGYPSVSARPAHTGRPILELNYYLREIPAIWWYLITG